MSGVVAALVIIVIIIVYLITMTIIAIFTKNKTFEKLGLIGWLGHAVHQMVDGKSYYEIRYHHYDKIVHPNSQDSASTPLTKGGSRPIYDPDF